jgi:hypothetical protein
MMLALRRILFFAAHCSSLKPRSAYGMQSAKSGNIALYLPR